MSKYIKTRNASQCRSHHQKMLLYYKDIPSIISSIDDMLKTSEFTESSNESSQSDRSKEEMR